MVPSALFVKQISSSLESMVTVKLSPSLLTLRRSTQHCKRDMKQSDWYFYVLRCNDESFYAGITTDVTRRLNEHNNSNKAAKYTRVRRPLSLVLCWRCESRSEAQRIEYKFKRLRRKQKEKVLHDKRQQEDFFEVARGQGEGL
jgi:putative endonuclease